MKLVLAGGSVIDGTGAPSRRADVVIEDGFVVAVDEPAQSHPGAEVRDAGGVVVAPGFIDVHSHADNAPICAEPDLSKLLQGVTTEVVGNCGLSLAPRGAGRERTLDTYLRHFFPEPVWNGRTFGDFLAETDRAGYVVNFAPLVGHGPLRIAAMGLDAREPTPSELTAMRSALDEALDAGAVGLSTGLIYPPGRFSDTEELIELARGLGGRPALYASHIRSEGGARMAAVAEAIAVGREAGVRVEISHHKAMGRAHWGGVRESLALVREARSTGVDVRFDVYPYTASSTSLVSCLPPHLVGLPDDELIDELGKPEVVERLRADLAREDWDNHVRQADGFDGILVSSTESQRFTGMTLEAIAADIGTDGTGALVEVLRSERLRATMVCFGMDESDIETALSDPLTSIGSDGLPSGMPGRPHPRQWGTFPRVLARYVRERGVLGLEEAVHRMTGLPAETFRLPGVGRVAPGYAADLVLFDPRTIADRATYVDSTLPPTGIREVIIGGVTVARDNEYSGARVARRLRSS